LAPPIFFSKHKWHPKKKNAEFGSITGRRVIWMTQKKHIERSIDAYKFKTSNFKTKHKYFEGELNPILISNFAQCNSKSHPPHPWASKVHDEIITISPVTMLVLIGKTETPRSRTQTLN
jgi:hypothetical protein